MNHEITRQTQSQIVFSEKPQEFLIRLGTLLMGMQQAYRTELAEAELILWREALKRFSIEDIEEAQNELLLNPPKQELGDGTVQIWRGMPKLPDVIQVIGELRCKRFAEEQRKRDEDYNAEMRQLKHRRDVLGEKFYGIEDLMRDFREKHGHELEDHFAMEPVTPAVKQETEAEETARLEARRQQMLADLRRAYPDAGV